MHRDCNSWAANPDFYLIALRKCWNISIIICSHSKSNMMTHDLTLATVSSIVALFSWDLLDTSARFSKDDTISWKTSWNHRKCKPTNETRKYIHTYGERKRARKGELKHITFIFSSSYGASGAVILVISLMQEATATFTSTSECFNRSSLTSAFISGERASCMDLAGDCSTFDRSSSICLNYIKKGQRLEETKRQRTNTNFQKSIILISSTSWIHRWWVEK